MQENPKVLIPEHIKNLDKRRILNDGKGDQWEPILFYRKENDERIALAAATELVVVAGEKKARKSLLLSSIAAARYCEDIPADLCLRFELNLEDRPVLWIDTEQPRGRVMRNRTRYHKVIGNEEDPTLYQYALRGMSPHQMKDSITHIAQDLISAGKPPGLIIIDQIADLSSSRDENDKTGAVEVVDFLNMLTDMTNALMAVSIHTNRMGTHTNGKIGSFLDQKTDCTFMLSVDDNWITTLIHKFSRENRMPGIKFTHDFDGLPKFISEDSKSFF